MQEFFPQQPAAGPVRTMEAKHPVDPAALKRWQDIWKSIEAETTKDLQKTVLDIERDALLKGADQAKALFNPEIDFRLSNPRAVSWFRQHGGTIDYIKGIQQTTADDLKKVVVQGLDEGWSYGDTAREIQKFFAGVTEERARTIAVHESAQAYEAGNRAFIDTIEDEGIEMEKFYQTSEDDRVSDLCRGNQADGWIPVNERHSSGVQAPPGHVNCRCCELYRKKGG